MMQIFNFIGSIFGYLLWFFFVLTKNYGFAIILFTIALKIIMFPMSIKQQKSMAQTSRMSGKQKELQAKYGKDKTKLNEEMAKLYEKEGVNPMGGCLYSFFPLLLMMGVYYAVLSPLSNTLHVNADSLSVAKSLLTQIPGIGGSFGNQYYAEIDIIKLFSAIKDQLTMFNANDLSNMEFFSTGFKFLGLDLLATPKDCDFASMMWLIPVLCLVSSLGTQVVTMRMQGNQMQQGAGCMKYMLYLMPLVSAGFAYTVPAAVGFYWIISTVFSFGQTVVLNKFYNADVMMAKEEAGRIALRVQEEEKVKPLSFEQRKRLAEKSGSQNKSGQTPVKKAGGPKSTGSKKKNNNSGSYMGTSKTANLQTKKDKED